MPRSNPDAREYSFALEDFHSMLELLPLLGLRQASKLAFFSDTDKARIAADIAMLEPVQRDCPTTVLPGTNALPKIPSRRVYLQRRVLVVRNNCEQWFNLMLN